MTRNKKIGIVLLMLPPLLFIGSIIGNMIAVFLINSTLTTIDPSVPTPLIFSSLKLVLSLFGLLGVVGFFTAMPAGVYFLAKSEEKNEVNKVDQENQ